MGRYCCCGAKISTNEVCTCDQTGWVQINSNEDLPKKDGIYYSRYIDNGGDLYEKKQRFTVIPKIESNYSNNPVNIHWEKECSDDYFVIAWKDI